MAWYHPSWQYRVKVTVLSSKVASNLTNFPVYVDLSLLPSNFHSHVKSDGSDIRMTKADGVTEVPREVVFYDADNDKGELHFKGDISSSSNTDFYIYYGNSSASDYASDATYGRNNVWTNDYDAVLHLQEGGTTTSNAYVDSSGNYSSGATGYGNVSTNSSSKIGVGTTFDGSGDYINIGTNTITGTASFTLSAWIKTDTVSKYSGAVSIGATGTNNSAYIGTVATAQVGTSNSIGGGFYSTNYGSGDTTTGAWRYVVLTFAGGTNGAVKLYVSSGTPSVSTTRTPSLDAAYTRVGRIASDTVYDFDGSIDEVRIASVERSASWISTEYNNQSSPSTFFSIGSQETLFDYILIDAVSDTDAGFTSGHPYASGETVEYTVQSSDELELNTTYYWRVRAKDPLGSNTWGDWSETRSFTTTNTVSRIAQKDLSYSVVVSNTIQKGLSYRVQKSSSTTKNLAYSVSLSALATKDLTYRVLLSQSLTKDFDYKVVSSFSTAKSLAYFVSFTSAITKDLEYRVSLSQSTTKGLEYKVSLTNTVAKSLAYVVVVESDYSTTKDLSYRVANSSSVSKDLSYSVIVNPVVSKDLTYKVITSSSFTKDLNYKIGIQNSLSKDISYSVAAEKSLSKDLSYRVISSSTASKDLSYRVSLSFSSNKNIEYRISLSQIAQKDLSYKVLTNPAITKDIEYRILTTGSDSKDMQYYVGISPAIRKDLTYKVEATHKITKNLVYWVTGQKSKIVIDYITGDVYYKINENLRIRL